MQYRILDRNVTEGRHVPVRVILLAEGRWDGRLTPPLASSGTGRKPDHDRGTAACRHEPWVSSTRLLQLEEPRTSAGEAPQHLHAVRRCSH